MWHLEKKEIFEKKEHERKEDDVSEEEDREEDDLSGQEDREEKNGSGQEEREEDNVSKQEDREEDDGSGHEEGEEDDGIGWEQRAREKRTQDEYQDLNQMKKQHNDEPVYPGAPLTKGQSLLLLMSYVLMHSLTGVAVQDLHIMFNEHFPGLVPATSYLFHKEYGQFFLYVPNL